MDEIIAVHDSFQFIVVRMQYIYGGGFGVGGKRGFNPTWGYRHTDTNLVLL